MDERAARSFADHSQHETTYIGCPECVADYVEAHNLNPLTGIEKAALDKVRDRINVHDDGVWAFFGSLERMCRGTVE